MERRTIAAGTLPNNVGSLGGWIADPQAVKPGSYMPQPEISPAQLAANPRLPADVEIGA